MYSGRLLTTGAFLSASFLMLPSLTSAATVTIGETAILSEADNGNGNLLLVQDANLSQAATIQSISFYVSQAAGDLRLGIYDATGPSGGPGQVKAQTNSFTPVVGWNTANVVTPVQLPAGNYWLAYLPSSNTLAFRANRSTGQYRYANFTFAAMPPTFPSINGSGATHWSLYSTLDTAPDITAPTVSITTPASGATVSGTVAVNASATDNLGVVGVQFKLDGTTLGAEGTTSPYSVNWDTATATNGSHSLTAVARDAAGNVTTSPDVGVTVSNTPPVTMARTTFKGAISLALKSNQSVPDTTPPSVPTNLTATPSSQTQIDLSWTASTDNVAVAGYDVLRDGSPIATTTLTSYSNAGLTAGTTYSYAVRAFDAASNYSALSSSLATTTQAPPPPGPSFTIGETSILSADDNGNGDLHVAQNVTLMQSATMQSLSFYVTTTGGNLRLGIYDATGSGGGPGTLRAQTNAFTPVGGWNTAPVITPVLLSPGTYWLAYLPQSDALGFKKGTTAGIGGKYYSFAYGPMPTTFATSPNTTASHWSFYATLGPGGGVGDTTPPTVAITSPTDGAQVSDIITVTADADDNVGVVGVQCFVDGNAIGVEDNEEPYGVDWDTRDVSNGAHTLTARARDAAGNSALSAPVTVNVANTNVFQNEILATGFNLPTNIEFLPDGRMLVGEIAGVIKLLPPPYTTPDPAPFADLDINISGYAGLQQGIFDIMLDPNFTTNHYYYVFYTNDSPNRDRLSRFTANADLTGTIAGSEVILYEDPQTPNTEHHGGAINFGNDGKIYFTTGEHMNGANSQDRTNPRGKIHRINPDGSVPTDNPFYDGAGPNWDSIWAYGLRNPFRAYYDTPTGKLYVADVGGNNSSTAYEEVDLGASGKNYGWPNCEFGTCGNPAYTAALYAYPHDGRDASITGGFVYHGSQFPSSFQGSYFYADYTQNWIKRLTFDAQGNVNGVFNFEPADGSVDGPYGDIVYLAEGPDGALYYVDLGYSDVGGSFGVSKIRRIRYISSNLPPTAIASANPTSGPSPLTVDFSSAGSTDPEGQPLTYSWTFGDGATSTIANPQHTYTNPGPYTARLTTSDGVSSTLSTPLTIRVGAPPTATILSPTDGSFFIAGDVIPYSGDATDPDDGALPASAFTWDIDFLHAGHVHPGVHAVGVKNGTFTIPTSGHDFSGNTRYRFTLTVTDSNGLTDVKSVIVWPTKVNLTFDTVPQGLTLYLDSIAQPTPLVYDTLVGFQHSIEARNQSTATTTYTFQSWSDGGAQTHTITVPGAAQTYSATYTATPNSTPITMGETTVFSEDDSGNGNLLLVQDATLSQPATIQSLSFYVTTLGGDLRLGVYDATGPSGGPGNLLVQTNAFTPIVGWNTMNVIAPAALPAGNYWLAYLPQSSSLHFPANRSIGQFRYGNFTFGPMPATFPSIAGSGVTHWSLYGTLTP